MECRSSFVLIRLLLRPRWENGGLNVHTMGMCLCRQKKKKKESNQREFLDLLKGCHRLEWSRPGD